MNIDIKVIELDYKRAKKLSEQYSDVSVICGDGTDQDFLDEMMIENQDCCISLTGIDEENALISMFAAQRGVKKTITKINRLAILKVIRSEEVKSIITPKRIIADAILRSIRSIKNAKGSNVEQLYTLAGDEVQALQFKAHPKSKLIGKSLETIKLKNNTIIAVISRNNTLFFPTGKDAILEEDKVLVVTKHIDFSDLDDILERE
jgi:trk family potassium uptake protein